MDNIIKEQWNKYIESKILSVRREREPFTSNEKFATTCESLAIEFIKYCSKNVTDIEYDNPSEHIIALINGILLLGMINENEESTEKCAKWYSLWVDAIAKKINEGQSEEQIRDFLKEKRIYDEVANAIIYGASVRINDYDDLSNHTIIK